MDVLTHPSILTIFIIATNKLVIVIHTHTNQTLKTAYEVRGVRSWCMFNDLIT